MQPDTSNMKLARFISIEEKGSALLTRGALIDVGELLSLPKGT
jgi:hypothetical protein